MAFNNYLEDENDKPYFTTNSLAYYYDKMEGFAKAVEGSAKALNLTKEEIEKRIALRLAEWDKNLESFDSSVEKLLSEWVDDGTLTHVIDSTLIDQKIAPVTAQLEGKVGGGVKLKPEEFSDESLALVTGNGTVNVLSVPQDNSVTPIKIANGAIISDKLSSNYDFKKELTTESLSAVTTADMLSSGSYFTKTALTGKPPEAGNNAIVIMKRSSNATNENFIVEYHDTDDTTKYYRRIGRIGSSAGVWRKIEIDFTIPDGGLSTSKLTPNFNYRRRIEAGESMDTVFTDGNYMISANNSGVYPVGYDKAISGYLEVSMINDRWTKQRLMPYNSSDMIFERTIDKNVPTVGAWNRIITQNALDQVMGGNNFLTKKIVCFGESTTMNGTYPEQMGAMMGATAYNVGFGGSTIVTRGTSMDAFSMVKIAEAVVSGDYSLQDANVGVVSSFSTFLNRLKSIDFTTVEYAVLYVGGNDFTQGVALGTNETSDTVTVKGALNTIISSLNTKYPKMKVILVSPTWRNRFGEVNADVDYTPNSAGLYMKDYVQAEKEIANLKHTPFFDLFHNSGINNNNALTYIADGIHPTAYGYTHIAKKISAFLKTQF